MTNQLDRGREAFEARRWDAAYEALQLAAAERRLEPADLWRLGLAAYLTGRDDAFAATIERAHYAWLKAGDAVAAARCAFWLGFHLAERGEMGPATGWFGRARRLLDRAGGDRVEHGYLLVPVAYGQLQSGDPEAAFRTAAAAVDIGERFRDADLLALGVHLQGRARLEQGRLEHGLALLDESMIGVTAGEVSPLVAGLVYCSVIGACRRVYALERAHEWTAALHAWCDAQPDLVPYRGQCLAYRAEILQLHGAWQEALVEAARAAEITEMADHEAAPAQRAAAGAAHYQRAEVHRLRGEFADAEDAYRAASRLGREPQPGLALLRLAQGDMATAAAGIDRVLAETQAAPGRARLLPARVEIGLAAGDLDAARLACREMEEVAGTYGAGVLDASAAHARGAVALAAGDALGALVALRQASQGWRALDAPYEEARVRVLIARACRELGDEEAAAMEREAAHGTFARLGAAVDLAALNEDDTMRGGGPTAGATRSRDHGLTPREIEVLTLLATGLTNRAIARQLFISEKTVARHVSNLFAKLGLSSRAAATAYAYEHGLVEPQSRS